MTSDFWKGKRVFVTGHTGFKGSWLAVWLTKLGAKVTGFALEPVTQPNLFELARVEAHTASIIGDVRDLDKLKHAVKDAEIVIHMAAQPLVRAGYDDPVYTYETNVIGTVNVLEACRLTPSVRAVLVVTTDKCYENNEWIWGYRENEPMGGIDPYSSSKGCAELVVSAYRRSYGMNLASARAGNVIGGGDWSKDRLMPDVIRAFVNKETVELRNPNAVRPWQHVLDCLSGYLTLTEALALNGDKKYACGFNFGPKDGDIKTVRWMMERLSEKLDFARSFIIQPGEHPHEAGLLKLDISKAKSVLGWEPVWDAEKAVEMTAAWVKAWMSGEDIHDLCSNQIEEYERVLQL